METPKQPYTKENSIEWYKPIDRINFTDHIVDQISKLSPEKSEKFKEIITNGEDVNLRDVVLILVSEGYQDELPAIVENFENAEDGSEEENQTIERVREMINF